MFDKIIRSPFPSQEIPILSVGEYCVEKVAKYGEKTLLIDAKSGKSFTANEIIEKAHAVASALLMRQLTSKEIICFFSTNNVSYTIALFSIYMLGNTYSPSLPKNNFNEIESQLKDNGATIMFTSMANCSIVRKLLNAGNTKIRLVVVLNGEYEDFVPFHRLLIEGKNERIIKIPHFSINPREDLFSILYTSGSTGAPKGVMLTHYASLRNISNPLIYCFFEPLKDDDAISGHFSLSHLSGTFAFPLCMSIGLKTILHEELNMEKIAASIEKYKITYLGLFTSIALQLLDDSLADRYDLSCLKHIAMGGAPFPSELGIRLINKFNLQSFRNVYGLSEYPRVTIYNDPEYIPGSCGQLTPNVEMIIRDVNSGKSLGPYEDGELCIRGPSIFKGYVNDPESTRNTFTSDGWLRTGDIGHYDENAHIYLTDRIKEMILYKNYYFYPSQIENLLLSHEAIQGAVVVPVPHQIDTQWPRAYIVRNPKMNITKEEIQKILIDYKSDSNYYFHGGVIFIDHTPKTCSGKVDRQYFKKLVRDESSILVIQ